MCLLGGAFYGAGLENVIHMSHHTLNENELWIGPFLEEIDMTELLSFHNDSIVKEKYLNRVIAHAKADEIIKGTYWEEGKGCAVGCTIHSDSHKAYEKELGLPEWLARLEDTIFEGLPNKDAKVFPQQFLEAIPIGKNLNKVKWQFCIFVLKENIERVLLLEISDELKKEVIDAIKACLKLHEDSVTSGQPAAESAWSAAESAAWSARSAARSAAESARSAAWSARSAAWSARSAARSARSARSAARSAAESAWSAARSAAESAWSAAFKRYADELLRLLKDA